MEHEVSERYLLKQQDAKLKSLKGFTLLEMVISIAIMVLVVAAASVIFNQTLVVYRYSTSKIIIAQEAQIAMKWIANDIQSATDITATSDIDEITIVVAGISIHYYMDNTDPQNITIQRAENGVPSLLAENVIGLSFHYYDLTNDPIANGDPVANKAQLKTVEIDIVTRRNNQEFRLNSVARYGS